MKKSEKQIIIQSVQKMYDSGTSTEMVIVPDWSLGEKWSMTPDYYAVIRWPSNFYHETGADIHMMGGLLRTRDGAEKRISREMREYRNTPGCANHTTSCMFPRKILKIDTECAGGWQLRLTLEDASI
jgi:hypothetical protein